MCKAIFANASDYKISQHYPCMVGEIVVIDKQEKCNPRPKKKVFLQWTSAPRMPWIG